MKMKWQAGLFLLFFLVAVTAMSAIKPTTYPDFRKTYAREITVAVIDTGVDADHPSLRDHLWTNPGESGLDSVGHDKATNGLDDDGNGFVDDVHGWNFVTNSPATPDRHGHGTHVAGLIVGEPRESPVRLMVLKYFDPDTSEISNLQNTVKAIRYAARMGADIVNYSGGGLAPSLAEAQAVRETERRNILFVAAAGNGRANSDEHPFYPADYGFGNLVSVAALTSPGGRLLASSNFGEHTVDLVAPGQDLLSTMPGGSYGRMSGTSQAAAVVTGVAARWLALDPRLKTPAQVLTRLVHTGIGEADLKGKTKYGVRLNAAPVTALAGLD